MCALREPQTTIPAKQSGDAGEDEIDFDDNEIGDNGKEDNINIQIEDVGGENKEKTTTKVTTADAEIDTDIDAAILEQEKADEEEDDEAAAEMRRIMGSADFAGPSSSSVSMAAADLDKKAKSGQKRKREDTSQLPHLDHRATFTNSHSTDIASMDNSTSVIHGSTTTAAATGTVNGKKTEGKYGLTWLQLDQLRGGHVLDPDTGDRVFFMPSFIEDPWSHLLLSTTEMVGDDSHLQPQTMEPITSSTLAAMATAT